MDPRKITSFAQLLKDNGDKILNSDYKLTLSGLLLRSLNDSFPLVVDQNEICPPRNFQVAKSNNSKSEAIRDLLFIHDFVQKTSVLCLTTFECDDNFEGIADITKFRNLKKLEIQKLKVQQITGIQQLRSQLKEIACVRKSISSVKDIISDCGGDLSNGFVWNELKCADFSCNGLTSIDCSLEFAPWLQNLNLSHNQIVSADALKWLKHLKFIDLSFNKLSKIPMFNVEACKGIQILILSNNFIEDLSGLTVYRFDALYELDLSGNCLLDHTVLLPVSSLASLKYLNLMENPISFYPKHREFVSKYLNKNISNEKFILNSDPLSKYEKSLIGKEKISFLGYSSSFRGNQKIPNSNRRGNNSRPNSLNSDSFLPTNDGHSSDTSVEGNLSNTSLLPQKKLKVREPVILDHGNEEAKPNDKIVALEGKTDHLDTKKDIENLRKQFGEHWLKAEGSINVYEKIGVNYPMPRIRNSAETMIKSFLNSNDTESKSSFKNDDDTGDIFGSDKTLVSSGLLTSTPTESSMKKLECAASSITMKAVSGEESNSSDYKTAESADDIGVHSSEVDKHPIYESPFDNPNITVDEDIVSDPEDNEVTYNVAIDPTGEELYLVVSDTSIREKSIISGRTKTKWVIKMLESCERIKSDIIRINFDTARKDKTQRSYKMDISKCQKLEQYLRDILSNRPLSAMNQKLFRCVNCSAHFSREISFKKLTNDVKCPECRSIYVVEIKESPKTKQNDKSKKEIELQSHIATPSSSSSMATTTTTTTTSTTSLQHSASQSSIAPSTDAWRSPFKLKLSSIGSLNESSSCSKISNSESSFDSNQSVAGSSNYERDHDTDIINSKNGMESDIEILSNPSQSSIEVLDSIYASRKHSEERKISQIPSLDTITDDNLSTTLTDQCTSTNDDDDDDDKIVKPPEQVNNDKNIEKKNLLSANSHLTESSSSGSVTDSICTSYEQSHGKSPDNGIDNAKTVQANSGNMVKNADSSMISSMLNNLLQSTNLLLSKSQKNDEAQLNHPIESFKFSYTNFTDTDHRIKLYLYQNIFEDENEHFKWLAKAIILDESLIDEYENGFDGILVLSTTKCYILKVTGVQTDDDPQKWLKRHLAVTVDRLEYFKVLPWKFGLEFQIKGIGSLHLLLLDILRTDSLLLHISSNLPDTCSIEYQISENLLKKLYNLTENMKIEMFGILNSCDIVSDDKKGYRLCSILITEANFYLGRNFKWIINKLNLNFDLCEKQEMSNLVEYKKINDLSFILYFLDETNDKCENWELVFETVECAESTFNAISQSWEKLFDVPLTSN